MNDTKRLTPQDQIPLPEVEPSPLPHRPDARIYVVRVVAIPAGGEAVHAVHLVRAKNRAQALAHVVSQSARVALATQDDLVNLLVFGVKIEEAGIKDDQEADEGRSF